MAQARLQFLHLTRPVARLLFILGVAAVVLFALHPGDAWAKRKVHAQSEYRVRLLGLYGPMTYTSSNALTSVMNIPGQEEGSKFTGLQPGAVVTMEAWHGRGLGILAAAETFYVDYIGRPDNYMGKPIYSGGTSLMLGYRIIGRGGLMNPELAVFGGPAITWFPDVRSYVDGAYYDRTFKAVVGGKAGLRGRIPLTKDYAMEAGGYWTAPYRVLGGGLNMNWRTSRLFGGWLTVDHRINDGLAVSFGGQVDYRRLDFIPNEPNGTYGTSLTHSITLDNMSGNMSVVFWF